MKPLRSNYFERRCRFVVFNLNEQGRVILTSLSLFARRGFKEERDGGELSSNSFTPSSESFICVIVFNVISLLYLCIFIHENVRDKNLNKRMLYLQDINFFESAKSYIFKHFIMANEYCC